MSRSGGRLSLLHPPADVLSFTSHWCYVLHNKKLRLTKAETKISMPNSTSPLYIAAGGRCHRSNAARRPSWRRLCTRTAGRVSYLDVRGWSGNTIYSWVVRAWVETQQHSSAEIRGEERRGQQRMACAFFVGDRHTERRFGRSPEPNVVPWRLKYIDGRMHQQELIQRMRKKRWRR
jgi:hypothetical protein